MRAISKAEFEMLERLVDATSLRSVIGTLGTICSEKAAHISENWQDNALARLWDSAGTKLETVAESNAVRRIS